MKINTLALLSGLLLLFSCGQNEEVDPADDVDFRQEMRNFVINISKNAKAANPNFFIIPQNGIELVTQNGEPDGPLSTDYLAAIDGHGQEDLFFGYDNDDEPTGKEDSEYLQDLLNVSKNAGNTVLVTDYCSTPSRMDQSFTINQTSGYVSFAANHRELDNIPTYPQQPFQANTDDISSLAAAKNFLYLLNTENFASKTAFINAVAATNYDLIIMDLFFEGDQAFTAEEIDVLKQKANGGKRLVVCYMSIGEAEDYRYYWQSSWNNDRPDWLQAENPDWAGNFKVKYWNSDWQQIIYGTEEAYLTKIMDVGFDGVYLDIIDAFEYYE